MATKKKGTAKDNGGKAPSYTGDDPNDHLLRAFLAARRRAEHDPTQRDEDMRLAVHLDLLQSDSDYRAKVLKGLDAYLDPKPKGPPQIQRQRQAQAFLEGPAAAILDEHEDDQRRAAANLLANLGAYPLILGDVPLPKLADVLDEAERVVRRELEQAKKEEAASRTSDGKVKKSTTTIKRQRNQRVVRALLRAVYRHADADADTNLVRKLYQ